MSPDTQFTWDLSPLFSGLSDPRIAQEQAEIRKFVTYFSEKWTKDESYLHDENSLYQAYSEFESFATQYTTIGKAGFYLGLLEALDSSNSEVKQASADNTRFAQEMSNKLHFFDLKLGKIDSTQQERFLSSELLKKYRYSLKKLFENAKYDLSEPEEKVFTLVSPFAESNWTTLLFQLLNNETVSFKGSKKTLTELAPITLSHSKEERDLAGRLISKVLRKHEVVAEAELNSVLGFKAINMKLRGTKRVDEFRLAGDDVTKEMIDTLLSTVENYRHIPHRYFEIKAKLLNQKKLEHYERSYDFPLNDGKKIPYSEAIQIVSRVFKRLDPEFNEIFTDMQNKRRIDVYPKKGKTSGAFCAGFTTVDPVYILLNYTDKPIDVTTLAHEMGHAINDILMQRAKINEFAYGVSMATAEVASTFFEDFVLEEMTKNLPKEQKLFLLMNRLNDDISAIFRQVACYRFEQDLAETYDKNAYISKEDIGKMFQKRMEEYMGPAVSQKKGGNLFWTYWGHIRSPFYVYSYASGQLISKSLQSMVRSDSKSIELVKDFLATGRVMSPEDIFRKLGLDIIKAQFWELGLKEVESLLSKIEQLI